MGTPWPPCVLMLGCHVPMVMLTWCPQPQCPQPHHQHSPARGVWSWCQGQRWIRPLASPPRRRGQPGAVPSCPAAGGSWRGQSLQGGTRRQWQGHAAWCHLCHRARMATATLGRGAQEWRQAGDLRHVPERGRDSGCSDSSSWGAAWPPPSWLCSCARSCSEKERSRFSDTSVIGESSSCKAMDTALPWRPPHTLRTSRVPLTSTLPLFRVPSLTSETFISSISARVGALSRTRGRGRAGTVLTGVRESSRQELEARRPEQAWGMQGREL